LGSLETGPPRSAGGSSGGLLVVAPESFESESESEPGPELDAEPEPESASKPMSDPSEPAVWSFSLSVPFVARVSTSPGEV
jgi:hypothetical protein